MREASVRILTNTPLQTAVVHYRITGVAYDRAVTCSDSNGIFRARKKSSRTRRPEVLDE
jgi:hypothetical protein